MARPREFDEGVALDRAMEVFWKKGYQATSTDDLMAAMGIGRGSFYNAFGSKKETYLRTLDRYLELIADETGPYAMLFEMEPGVDALAAMLTRYLDTLTTENAPHGCYFVHVAKEHRGEDPDVKRAIAKGLVKMREAIAHHVEAAKRKGMVPEHVDPEAAALLMMSIAWGSHVLVEAGIEKRDALAAALMVFELAGSPAG